MLLHKTICPTPQEDTTDVVNIPTLVGVARKVAHQDKVKLDEKQYIAYEIIACTFLIEACGRRKR